MSGPAWTQRPARWPPSRTNSAEGIPISRDSGSTSAIPTQQEAPYLTHLTRHHGVFTLTAPPNMGRRHSTEEREPVPGPSTSPPKRVKKKKHKRAGLDPGIADAVINAGRRTPSPSHQDSRYHPTRPAVHSSASERPSLLDRNSNDDGMAAGRISLVDERDYEARVAENRGRDYARGDAWDDALDVPLDSAPPFAPPNGPSPALAIVPPPPHLAPQDPLSFPSYPPPEYPFTPLDSFRPDLPITTPVETTVDGDDEEDSAESDFVFSENDPLVLAWEADRAAGLSLDERITRDLDRRILAAAPNSPSSPAVSLVETIEIESPQEEALREAELDQEQERMRYQRREIELAEGQRDEPRIARALSIYAGRRFAEAAERRISGRRRSIMGSDTSYAERRRSAKAPPPMPTPISTTTATPPPPAPVASPVSTPVSAVIDEEESESDGENSAPAQVARNASSRRVAEATERRLARARMVAVVESPGGNSEEEIYHGAVEEQEIEEVPKPSTFQQLFPPRPLFGSSAISVVPSPAITESVLPPPIPIIPSTSAFAPPPPQQSHIVPPHSPTPSSTTNDRSPLRTSQSSSTSLLRRSHPSGPRTMPPVPPSRPAPPPPPPALPVAPAQSIAPAESTAEDEFASVRAMMTRLERSSNRRPAPPPPRPRLPPSSNSARSLEGLPIAQRFATVGNDRYEPPPTRYEPPSMTQRPPLPVPPPMRPTGMMNGIHSAPEVPTASSTMVIAPPATVSAAAPPIPTRPLPPIEDNTIHIAPPVSDFVYTDLDVLLSRLHTQDVSNYEELIMLGEVLGPARPVVVGSTMEEIGTLGVARVELERKRIDKQGRTKTKLSVVGLRCSDCSICMVRFRTGDFAVVLPICLHIFHADCIGRWLSTSRKCPLCRGDVFEPKIVDI